MWVFLKIGSFFNSDGHSLGKSLGHLLAGETEGALEGWLGDSHLLGGFFLDEAFLVAEFKRFPFLRGEDNLLQRSQGNSPRLKVKCVGLVAQKPPFSWPNHCFS